MIIRFLCYEVANNEVCRVTNVDISPNQKKPWYCQYYNNLLV